MKFCLVTTFFPPAHFGGDAIAAANLANLLAGAGHEVQVIHCVDSFELLKKNVEPSEVRLHPGVEVHGIRSPWGPLSPLLTHLTGHPGFKHRTLARILSRNFDVIHWHNLSLVGGPGGMCLGKGIKLCTLHEYWWTCPTSLLFRDNQAACTSKACFRCTLVHGRPPQIWRGGGLLARAARQVDRFLAPSEFVRKKYAESELGIQAVVLPHFVVPTATVERLAGEPYYLFVGRLEKVKGLQTIIPLFGETGRRLRIAGSGSYERELKAMAAPYPRIEFLGQVRHDRLTPLYANARATILASVFYETFGLVLLESLQQRTPVIVSRYGASPELVADTGGGAVYSTVSDLAEVLDDWDRNPGHAAELGRRGWSRLGKYAASVHLENYLRIIDEARPVAAGAVCQT